MFRIRRVTSHDAADLLQLCRFLDEETSFMLYEPEERLASIDEQKKQIESILKADNQMILVAESNGRLVGHLHALGGRVKRNHKTIYLVIGILQQYVGLGIGQALFLEMEKWAREVGTHRLELTVMTHNVRAVALYKKMGFGIEGIKRENLFVNGQYVDEYMMAKLL